MKLFKNPVFAVCLCLILIIGSTILSSGLKLQRRYQRTCNNLCYAMEDFASRNGLSELESSARDDLNYTTSRIKDMHMLVLSYNSISSGYEKSEKKDVEKAIKKYNSLWDTLDRFPASFYANLLDLD